MDFKKEVTRICCDMYEVQQEFANHIKELYEIAKEKIVLILAGQVVK